VPSRIKHIIYPYIYIYICMIGKTYPEEYTKQKNVLQIWRASRHVSNAFRNGICRQSNQIVQHSVIGKAYPEEYKRTKNRSTNLAGIPSCFQCLSKWNRQAE
jgi:hypothetical protein